MKFCPQCGTAFEPEARFCLECGFDGSTVTFLSSEPQTTPEGFVDKTHEALDIPLETQESKADNSPVCPQCGTAIEAGDRFCLECGYDTSTRKDAGQSSFTPVEQPAGITEPIHNPPIAQQPKPIIPPPVHSAQAQTESFSTLPGTQYADSAPAKKKSWLLILLVIIVVGALAAGGWFAYTRFLSPQQVTVSDTASTTAIPETTITDAEIPETESAETTQEVASDQPAAPARPKSKIDQELEKYREKEKNKSAQQTAPAQQTKPGQGVKISTNANVNSILSKVLHEVGRKEDPKSKKPKNPAKFTLQEPTMIVRITTDHYNDGMGTSGVGTISIKDKGGNVLGTYKVNGKTGKDGAPNAKWVVEPNKMFEKGTYYIWDSDFSTWSKNFVGNGFVVVEGYEVK